MVTITFGVPSLAVPAVTSVTKGNAGELIVTWNEVANANFYDVYYNYTDNTTNPAAVSSVTSPYTITGLAGATTYHVWVVARNACVESGFGESVNGTTSSFPQSPSFSINLFPSAENILPQSVSVSRTSYLALSVTGIYAAYQWYIDGEEAGSGATYNFIGIGKTLGASYEAAVIARSPDGTNYFGRCRVTVTE